MSAKERLGFSAEKRIKKAKANQDQGWQRENPRSQGSGQARGKPPVVIGRNWESVYLASQLFHKERREQSLRLLGVLIDRSTHERPPNEAVQDATLAHRCGPSPSLASRWVCTT